MDTRVGYVAKGKLIDKVGNALPARPPSTRPESTILREQVFDPLGLDSAAARPTPTEGDESGKPVRRNRCVRKSATQERGGVGGVQGR